MGSSLTTWASRTTRRTHSTRANTGGGYFSDFGPISISWREDSLSANLRSWHANMVEFEDTLRLERAELDSCEEARKANRQYRTSHGTYRIKRTQ